jgi:hypothetical protein
VSKYLNPIKCYLAARRRLRAKDEYPNGSGAPVFFHQPGGTIANGISVQVEWDFGKLARRMIRNRDRLVFRVPENITFLTFSNYESLTLLEKCYKALDVAHEVVGRDIRHWSWYSKILAVKEYFDSGRNSSEYLVVTDADDVLMVNDPSRIVDVFQSYRCDVLLQGTFADWPPSERLSQFELSKYPRFPFQCHPNSGGYMARASVLKEIINEIVSGVELHPASFSHNGQFDDQMAWREMHHKYYPRIKVDCETLIFKRFDLFRFIEFENVPFFDPNLA